MARAGPRKVARYGDQFKASAVKLGGLPGVLIQDVAAALDMLRNYMPFYNQTRLHSSLGYVPPATYERLA